jgi:hypothetical protein
MRRVLWAAVILAVATFSFFASTGRLWQLQRVGAFLVSEAGVLLGGGDRR